MLAASCISHDEQNNHNNSAVYINTSIPIIGGPRTEECSAAQVSGIAESVRLRNGKPSYMLLSRRSPGSNDEVEESFISCEEYHGGGSEEEQSRNSPSEKGTRPATAKKIGKSLSK